MEIKKDYSSLFNSITDVIGELSTIIWKANLCMELLKQAQVNAEEIVLSDNEKYTETEN